jgi:general secretion pathway protein K
MNKPYQQGAVLVIALLIVAIISALVVDFSMRFQLSVGRAENRFFNSQLQQALFSLEHAAILALRKDKEADKDSGKIEYDHLGEVWARANEYKALIAAEFADVMINELIIEDAQARFNINQLAKRSQGPVNVNQSFVKRYTAEEKHFMRLLQTVPNDQVSSSEAEAITQAVIDWLDSDSDITGVGGAESDYYLSQEKPFRAANDLMVSITELRLIKGVTKEIYTWIAPLVVALPEPNGINVNTAVVTVLQGLNKPEQIEPLSSEDAQMLSDSRPSSLSEVTNGDALVNSSSKEQKGFENVAGFLSSKESKTVFGAGDNLIPKEGLTTGSNYFILTAEVELDTIKRRSYSLLKRTIDNKTNLIKISVIRRSSESLF